jgi:hypothetical protein
MVDVALEDERRGGVPGEGLEIPYGLPVARQQAQATIPEVMEPDREQPRSDNGPYFPPSGSHIPNRILNDPCPRNNCRASSPLNLSSTLSVSESNCRSEDRPLAWSKKLSIRVGGTISTFPERTALRLLPHFS